MMHNFSIQAAPRFAFLRDARQPALCRSIHMTTPPSTLVTMIIIGMAQANLVGSHRVADAASCTPTEKVVPCHSSCSRLSCHKCRCGRCHFCRRPPSRAGRDNSRNATSASADLTPDRSGSGGAPQRPASSGVLSSLAVYLAVISWCTYRSLRSTATGMVDGDVAAADARAAKSHRTISPRTQPACS